MPWRLTDRNGARRRNRKTEYKIPRQFDWMQEFTSVPVYQPLIECSLVGNLSGPAANASMQCHNGCHVIVVRLDLSTCSMRALPFFVCVIMFQARHTVRSRLLGSPSQPPPTLCPQAGVTAAAAAAARMQRLGAGRGGRAADLRLQPGRQHHRA